MIAIDSCRKRNENPPSLIINNDIFSMLLYTIAGPVYAYINKVIIHYELSSRGGTNCSSFVFVFSMYK